MSFYFSVCFNVTFKSDIIVPANCDKVPLCLQLERPVKYIPGLKLNRHLFIYLSYQGNSNTTFVNSFGQLLDFETKAPSEQRRKSNFFFLLQGMLFAMSDCAKSPAELVRLWMHEASRVYRDKLLDEADFDMFDKILKDCTKKTFEVGIQI